jgi:hypothetical protein
MWANTYVGLPWKERGRDRGGIDCFGLVRLVLIEQRGVRLPSFAGDYDPADGPAIAGLIEQNKGLGAPVPPGAEAAFDVVLCRMPWLAVPTEGRPGQGRDAADASSPRIKSGGRAAGGAARLLPWHVGIVVRPGLMLHVTRALGAAVVDRYRGNPRLAHALAGFARIG